MRTKFNIDFTKLPSQATTHAFVDGIMELLFPQSENLNLEALELQLGEKFVQLLAPLKDKLTDTPDALTNSFFSRLETVVEALEKDAKLFLQSDPAAECVEEVVLAYPGFYAIAVYRIANEVAKLSIPILPRIMTEYAHTKTGIDIHPEAVIGIPFFIDHGTGVVIGQTTVIGSNVKIYQGVTLGALAVKKEEQGAKRHPTIENDVIIYAGSCILGGATVIGRHSVIGGNVWLTESVAPFSLVYHKSNVQIRDKSEMKQVIDFVI